MIMWGVIIELVLGVGVVCLINAFFVVMSMVGKITATDELFFPLFFFLSQ